jgi:uncharacterized membrane protein YcfT
MITDFARSTAPPAGRREPVHSPPSASPPAGSRTGRRGVHAARTGPGARRSGGDPAPGARVLAVDAARGLAIVLVVVLHAADWLDTGGIHLDTWIQANIVIAALRMPLFFAVAGVVGSKLLRARWPDLIAGRVTLLFWVYLAWQPIGSLVGLIVYDLKGEPLEPSHMLVSLALTPIRPRLELWFVWALALMFLTARLTRRIPVPVQLVVSGALSAVCLWRGFPISNPGWLGLFTFYVFFLLGLHHRERILRLSGQVARSPWLAVVLLAAWTAVALPEQLLDLDRFIGPALVVRLLGLVAGIALASAVARGRLLRYLGARTLPIYLAHTPFIIILVRLIQLSGQREWAQRLSPVLPLALTLVVIPLCLVTSTLLSATPARVLYEPPARLTFNVFMLCTGRFRAGQGRRTAAPGDPGPAVPAPLPSPYAVPATAAPAAGAGRRSGFLGRRAAPPATPYGHLLEAPPSPAVGYPISRPAVRPPDGRQPWGPAPAAEPATRSALARVR